MNSLTPAIKPENFPHGTFKDGDRIFSIMPTWVSNDYQTFDDYRGDIEGNYVQAARDYGCVITPSGAAYIRNPKILDQFVNKARAHPFRDDLILHDWFKPGNYDYFVHSDIGYAHDSLGMAMTHHESPEETEEDKRERIQRAIRYGRESRSVGKIVLDFALRVPVPEGMELPIDLARQIIFDLDALGFSIYRATYDGFESGESIQKLKNKGINAEKFSVDKDTRAYDTLLEVLTGGELDYYEYRPLFEELRGLVLKGKKIDHQENGSKDVSDAVAASVFQCNEIRPQETVYVRTLDAEIKQGDPFRRPDFLR